MTSGPDPSGKGPAIRSRIMYVESKAGGLIGPARIGRVFFNKSGGTLTYRGRSFRSLKGSGFKANYDDLETGDEYWISGPRRDGRDALHATHVRPEIDEDVREEYFRDILGKKPSRTDPA